MFFFHVLIVKQELVVPVRFHVCTYAHFCGCLCTCVQTINNFGSHSSGISTFFCYRNLGGLELLSRSGWLATEPQESTCVCLTCAGIISTCHHLAKRQRGFWDLNSVCKHPNVTPSPLIRCLRTRLIHLVSHVQHCTWHMFYFGLSVCLSVLMVGPRTSHTVGKCSTTEQQPERAIGHDSTQHNFLE